MKTCTKCKLIKDLQNFYFVSTRNVYNSSCKDCCKAYKAIIRATPKHKEHIKNYNKKWRQNNQDKVALWYKTNERPNRIKRIYGITETQYVELANKQNNCCAICNIHKDELIKPLYIDHCHETGTIRGLLCQKCNSGIGLLQDSITLLEKAIIYLKR